MLIRADAERIPLRTRTVNCVVTSPPYWRLRDYGVAGQIGLDSSVGEYVNRLVEVFREVRRVLRDDGTLWLNMGDSYASGGRKTRDTGASKMHPAYEGNRYKKGLRPADPPGVKPKDLVGIPWRVAFALQADGWYLRQDIIWSKPNPMPESVTDRCTKAHEYLFLLSKSPSYYFDQQAIAEPVADSTVRRLSQPGLESQAGSDRVPGKTNGRMKASPPKFGGNKYGSSMDTKHRTKSGKPYEPTSMLRNRRSVWTIATQPFKEAHFATFPAALVEPCILAGAPVGGLVLDPFSGSGTTVMVAERLGRGGVGLELNPQYIDIARRRLRTLQPIMEGMFSGGPR